MSFSSTVKDDLIKRSIKNRENGLPMMFAITASIGVITLNRRRGMGLKFTTESYQLAKLISRTAAGCFDVMPELSVHESNSRSNQRSAIVSLFGNDIDKILGEFHIIASDDYKPIVLESDEQMRLFLRGVFLACGSVNDPSKGYHLELVFHSERAAEIAIKYAAELNIEFKQSKRKDNIVAYLKDSEQICNFLLLIGATDAMLEIESMLAYRDTRNYANRTRNCDMGNIMKSTEAAKKQIEAIKYLLENGAEQLSEPLRKTAEVRLENPDATLANLADLLGMGKSGVNHRLQKLIKMSEELKIAKENTTENLGGNDD